MRNVDFLPVHLPPFHRLSFHVFCRLPIGDVESGPHTGVDEIIAERVACILLVGRVCVFESVEQWAKVSRTA